MIIIRIKKARCCVLWKEPRVVEMPYGIKNKIKKHQKKQQQQKNESNFSVGADKDSSVSHKYE